MILLVLLVSIEWSNSVPFACQEPAKGLTDILIGHGIEEGIEAGVEPEQ